MDRYKTLILILFGLSSISCSHIPFRKYFYISSLKTWEDAQLYCREKYTDLATFESIEEVNQLNRPATISGRAWFGLHDDPTSWKGTLGNDSNSWRWSTTGQKITSEYHNWRGGQPNYSEGKELCVLMETGSKWRDDSCSKSMGHFCYTDMGQNQKTYVFVSESRTWNEAQTYCREHHTDLALITSAEENTMAESMANYSGWIGLYRNPWAWSDMSPVQFTNWEQGQPNNVYGNQHCTYEEENHQWGDEKCGDPSYFICHEGGHKHNDKRCLLLDCYTSVRKSKITMKILMKSTSDVTVPVPHEEILQKISAAFTNQRWTHFKLQWKIRPQKAEEKLP